MNYLIITGLNAYLHRIGVVDSPKCVHCDERESVEHYLLLCRRYTKERTQLRRELGRTPLNLITLLGHAHVGALMRFVQATNRFPRYSYADEGK